MRKTETTPRFLLDVSVLLPLIDENHRSFKIVNAWADALSELPWASCPITENGFLRIISQRSYANSVSLSEAFELLERAKRHTDHDFWPDDVSLLDETIIRREHLIGHRQITDAYILALAVKHGGRLVTRDGALPVNAVVGATEEHIVRPA